LQAAQLQLERMRRVGGQLGCDGPQLGEAGVEILLGAVGGAAPHAEPDEGNPHRQALRAELRGAAVERFRRGVVGVEQPAPAEPGECERVVGLAGQRGFEEAGGVVDVVQETGGAGEIHAGVEIECVELGGGLRVGAAGRFVSAQVEVREREERKEARVGFFRAGALGEGEQVGVLLPIDEAAQIGEIGHEDGFRGEGGIGPRPREPNWLRAGRRGAETGQTSPCEVRTPGGMAVR